MNEFWIIAIISGVLLILCWIGLKCFKVNIDPIKKGKLSKLYWNVVILDCIANITVFGFIAFLINKSSTQFDIGDRILLILYIALYLVVAFWKAKVEQNSQDIKEEQNRQYEIKRIKECIKQELDENGTLSQHTNNEN